ncbi:DNA-directed RNA polymerase subunit alpha C-terminal domain-containing protein [Geodermatophilus sp. SYSU D00703]
MPIESPGGVPAGTIRDLGLPGRAVAALLRAGVTTTEELAGLSRRELAAIDGLGPGLISAIRNAVPEPVGQAPRAAPSEAEVHAEAVAAGIEPPDGEAPIPPPIPSFESLRAPRRRTTVDLIVPATPPPDESAPAAGPRPAPASGPRPATYADLRRLCVRGTRAAAGVPVRLAWWSLRAPVAGLRRLLSR